MDRRVFLASIGAMAFMPSFARASDFVDYTPGAITTALGQGQTILVDYSATWCSTCRRQERVINSLRSQDPSYDAAMTFIRVDWDTYRTHDVTTGRAIPRRSTLLVLKGDQELGRVVAGTSESQIKALMDLGL